MVERLRIEYGRKLTQQLGTDFDTSQLGGAWEFDIPDGSDIQTEYGKGYAVLRTIIDQFFDSSPAPKVLPGEKIRSAETPYQRPSLLSTADPEPVREQTASNEVVEGIEYDFSNARVWEVESKKTPSNKPYTVMRIGSKGQIPGNGYARVKTFNPQLMRKIEALQAGDHVDVVGKYEGWDGRDGRMYDFVPSTVEKVHDVRSG